VNGAASGSGPTSWPRPKSWADLHLIGGDPGLTTGLARLLGGELTTCAVPADDVDGIVSGWLHEDIPAAVGCERFVITRNTSRHSSQPHALHVTGVIKKCVTQDGRAVFVAQNMSDAKRLAGRELRSALGWHRTGVDAVHENDAVCHLLYLMARRYPEAFHALVSPHIH
jgi:hypothetical protein